MMNCNIKISAMATKLIFVLSLVKIIEGACPDVDLAPDFNTEQFLGEWYEIQAQASIFQSIKSCLKSNYSREEDGSIIVQSWGLGSSGEPVTTSTSMTISENPARMITNFVPGINPPYEVLSTDYTSYACVHSCVSLGPVMNDFVFIYSREKTLDERKIELCRSIFSKYDTTNVDDLISTPQLTPECSAMPKKDSKDEL